MPELQQAVLDRARQVLVADPRIAAAWVEGSLAGGTADPWSDVDLHVAVQDPAAVDGEELLRRIAPVISALTFPLGPVRLVAAAVECPVRVDLYVEPLDQVAAIPRLGPADVFHGDPPEFRIVETVMDPAALLARLVRGYFFGFMMPARLAGRQMWASLVLNAGQVLFQFVVPAMLARTNPGQVFREALHAERHLSPVQQQKAGSWSPPSRRWRPASPMAHPPRLRCAAPTSW